MSEPTTPSSCIAVSVIVPMYNAERYIGACLDSVLAQTGMNLESVEVVLYDDGSADGTTAAARAMLPRLRTALGSAVMLRGAAGPCGCGSARNRATEASVGRILVFQDADDVMAPDRLARTLRALPGVVDDRDATAVVGLVGGNFQRIPAGSTPRYQAYHNGLRGTTDDGGGLFAYAFRDAPLAMPTVACLRKVWEDVGKFPEGTGISEDLVFQYAAMERGYCLAKLDGAPLVHYRYHEHMTSNLLSQEHMLSIRLAAFEKLVVQRRGWHTFSIWGAGRDGKAVFKLLSEETKRKVVQWGEINPRKIGLTLYGVKIVHFSELKPPIAACVALDRRGREFERNLAEMKLVPEKDYVHLV